jgi:putative membrane protein
MILRLHGSILPAMAIPLLIVTIWSTAIRCISAYVHPRKSGCSSIAHYMLTMVFKVGINQVLLTVLGFVVALALSFRSSTAYERYV